jgi:hypothetical protein
MSSNGGDLYKWLWRVYRDLLAHERFLDLKYTTEPDLTWRDYRTRLGGLLPSEEFDDTVCLLKGLRRELGYRGDPGEVPPPPYE